MPKLIELTNYSRPDDSRCLKNIMGMVRATTGPETESDELDCLRRLQEATAITEEKE